MEFESLNDLDYYRKKALSIDEWRDTRLPFFEEVDTYLCPNRAIFSGNDTKGQRSDTEILTSVARLNVRTLVAGLMSGNTPQSFKWFNLVANQRDLMEDPAAKAWLYDETQAQFDTLAATNFYRAMAFHYLDASVFKCGLTLVEMSYTKTTTYTPIEPGTYTLGYDSDGNVNQVARDVEYTIAQMVEKFGLDNLSDGLREQYKSPINHNTKVQVTHYVGPNKNANPGSLRSEEKEWVSLWWEKGKASETTNAKFLRRAGYDLFPFLVTEWEDCPAFIAMPDILQLYRMISDKLLALEKELDPPLTGPAALLDENPSATPGSFIPDKGDGSAEKGVRPVYQIRFDLNAVSAEIEKVEAILRQAFFTNTLMMLSSLKDRQRTATEVIELKQELLMQFGPVTDSFNRMQDHNSDLVFSHRMKLGFVAPVPPSLDNAEFGPDYNSAMTQAQKMSGLGNVERIFNLAATMAQMNFDISKFNPDAMFDIYSEKLNAPPELIRSDEQAAAVRQAATQAQNEVAAAQSARLQAQTLKDLGTTPTDENSILERMAGAAAQ